MKIVDTLHTLNKWWDSGTVDPGLLYKRIRNEFSGVIRNLGNDSIVALTGPRGCGKTALFYHAVDYLLKLRTPPERVFFLPTDDPSLPSAGLEEILRAYTEFVVREPLEALTAPVYVLIDGAHRLNGWKTLLKRCVERGSRVKFILSAPSKALLFAPSDDLSLRCIEIFLPPLSPQQFTEFVSVYRESTFDAISFKSMMPYRSLFDSPAEYTRSLLQNHAALEAYREEKEKLLAEYCLAGGYPGYFGQPNLTAWHTRIRDELIDLGLYSDILINAGVKSPEKLKRLLFLVAAGGGTEQSFAELGKVLSLNTVTVINHLNLLRGNALLTVCENYSGNKFGVARKNKRIYLRDSGFNQALLRRTETDAALFEENVRSLCVTAAANFADRNGSRLYFWRRGPYEVDLVIDKGFELLPVAVMLKDEITRRDARSLAAFARTYAASPVRSALVVTRNILQMSENLCFVPYWLI